MPIEQPTEKKESVDQNKQVDKKTNTYEWPQKKIEQIKKEEQFALLDENITSHKWHEIIFEKIEAWDIAPANFGERYTNKLWIEKLSDQLQTNINTLFEDCSHKNWAQKFIMGKRSIFTMLDRVFQDMKTKNIAQ